MGCNSSNTGSQPKAGGKKGIMKTPVEYTYFNIGYGRADPIEQLCQFHGQPVKKNAVEMGQGPTSEFGTGLPQVTINTGSKVANMAQFGAIMRSLGIRFGYYDPKNWKAAQYCDPIVDCWGDIVGAVAGVAFAPDEEAKNAAAENFVKTCVKFHGLLEKTLTHSKGPYVAGPKRTIADFVLASYIGNFVTNPNNPGSAPLTASLGDTPKFKAYVDKATTTFPYLAARGDPQFPF